MVVARAAEGRGREDDEGREAPGQAPSIGVCVKGRLVLCQDDRAHAARSGCVRATAGVVGQVGQ